jgi:hypothetical protein
VHLTNNFAVQKVNEKVKQMLNLYVIVKKEVHGHMKAWKLLTHCGQGHLNCLTLCHTNF